MERLPDENLIEILLSLSYVDLCFCFRVSKRLLTLLSDDYFWKRKYVRDFGTPPKTGIRKAYRVKYVQTDPEAIYSSWGLFPSSIFTSTDFFFIIPPERTIQNMILIRYLCNGTRLELLERYFTPQILYDACYSFSFRDQVLDRFEVKGWKFLEKISYSSISGVDLVKDNLATAWVQRIVLRGNFPKSELLPISRKISQAR